MRGCTCSFLPAPSPFASVCRLKTSKKEKKLTIERKTAWLNYEMGIECVTNVLHCMYLVWPQEVVRLNALSAFHFPSINVSLTGWPR